MYQKISWKKKQLLELPKKKKIKYSKKQKLKQLCIKLQLLKLLIVQTHIYNTQRM